MTTANLSKTATLEMMVRLGDGAVDGALERAGREPTTDPQIFRGRNGYDPSLLSGWEIAPPGAIGPAAGDTRALRRGGSGNELKYRNFS
jgi:hypothetical protein